MTTSGGETADQVRKRHREWLSTQTELRWPRIREAYEEHGRGYWRGSYGDDPGFTYIPLARTNPLVMDMVQTYDPSVQFVVVVYDDPVGIYKARMLDRDQVAFLN